MDVVNRRPRAVHAGRVTFPCTLPRHDFIDDGNGLVCVECGMTIKARHQ